MKPDPPHRLVVLGGRPTFAEPVHVGRPQVLNRQHMHELLDQVMDRQWFTNFGPLVRQLEATLASRLNVSHCVSVCNATLGLTLLARALGLTGEVIVPSFTFVATAHCLLSERLTPVFCDVDQRTHLVDLDHAASLLTPATSAILATTVWGQLSNAAAVEAFAHKHGIVAIYDSAHSFGCVYGGRSVGSFGKAEVLSLHATKVLSAGEGGIIASRDAALAERARHLSNFGFVGLDKVTGWGTNAKLPELSAALALANLEALDAVIAVNRRQYDRFAEGLASIPGLKLLSFRDHDVHNYHYVVVDVDPTESPLTRDELLEVLWSENVRARRYFYPGCHRLEPYRSLQQPVHALPKTEAAVERTLVLPTGPQLGEEGAASICAIIEGATSYPQDVRRSLVARSFYPRPPSAR